MAKLISIYKNGNYFVEIYDDGTKIRTCNEDVFKPEFPECIDITLTKKCDGGCPYCYMGCTEDGTHATAESLTWLGQQLHPYTEVALNINDMSIPLPYIQTFLYTMKRKGVIVNITINQKHFMRNIQKLLEWQNLEYFKGIGISYTYPEKLFIENVKKFPNAIIHSIVGIFNYSDITYLRNNGLKLLLLGYKTKGRGEDYLQETFKEIERNTHMLEIELPKVFDYFDVVSFDNLAIEQLNFKEKLTPEEFEIFYMGDEGQFTFYIDLVDKRFARSSMDKEEFPLINSVDEMFQYIRTKYKIK